MQHLPTAPEPPNMPKPAGVKTSFGNASYNHGGYHFNETLADAHQNRNNERLARRGFSNSLRDIMSPQGAIQRQEQIYGDAMRPAFQQESDKRFGQVLTGLGNRLQGSYGLMTAQQQAMNEGLAKAQMEKEIYNSGQDQYDRMIGRAGNYGSLTSSVQDIRQKPAMNLAKIAGTIGPNVTGYGSNLANIYGSQSGNYQAQVQAYRSPLQQFSALAGTAAGVAGAIPTGGASLAPMAAGTIGANWSPGSWSGGMTGAQS